MDDELTFGQWLKRRRRGLGLTQRALGQLAGYSGETIRKVEAGDLRASVPMAERLAEFLQIDPAEREQFVRFARAGLGEMQPPLPTATVELPPSPAVEPAGTPPAPLAHRHNLPAALTTFVGREKAIVEVRSLVTTRRLVTLMGPGGIGKSRLALEAARALVAAFADGAWLVELATLDDPLLVPQAVAQLLEAREVPGQPILSAVTEQLRSKALLLILDNCEHLIDACAELAHALLRAAPKLHVLATSREALGLAGEVTFDVPPLLMPKPGPALRVEQVMRYEAAQLFVDRAVSALPGFRVTEADTSALARVCQQVEGIPLALELAAARVKLLRLEQIADRLKDRFRLLADGGRTGLPRHQALQATIDWSYGLLPEAERAVLRCAAVFAGGWDVEAAEAICAAGPVEPADILDLLAGLVRKSMIVVRREPDQEARYLLLDMIRDYARARLREAGEQEAVQSRHLDFYYRLADEAEARLHGADQAVWLARLRQELDNVRAALDWSIVRGQAVERGAHLAGALWIFWSLHGNLAEGVWWSEQARDRLCRLEGERSPEARRIESQLCTRAANVILLAGEARRAAEWARDGLRLCRSLDGQDLLAQALITLGWTLLQQGQSAEAKPLFEEALAVSEAVGQPWNAGVAHYQLGRIELEQGHDQPAERHWVVALALMREQNDTWACAQVLGQLTGLARQRGRLADARELLSEQLAVYRSLGVPMYIADALIAQAEVAHADGDYAEARGAYEEALAMYQEQDLPHRVSDTLRDLGDLALRVGELERAEALLKQGLALTDKPESERASRRARLLRSLGEVARCRRDFHQAQCLYRESLALSRPSGAGQAGSVAGLPDIALLWAASGQAARAARLFGAVEALAATVGAVVMPADRAEFEQGIAAARAALGEAAFATAWADGRTLTLEQAVAYALDERGDAPIL